MFPLRQCARAFGRELPAPGAAAEGLTPQPDSSKAAASGEDAGSKGVLLTVLGPVAAAPSAAAATYSWAKQRQQEAAGPIAAATVAPRGAKKKPVPPLPLPAVIEPVQLQLRSLTASPVVAAHYSKAELLLANAFETLQSRKTAPASAPVRRARGGWRGGMKAPVSAGGRSTTGAAAAEGTSATTAAAFSSLQAAGGTSAGPLPVHPIAAAGDSSSSAAAQPPSKRATRTDTRIAAPTDALQQLLAGRGSGRISPLRSKLLASANARQRRAVERAESAGWGQASIDHAMAAAAVCVAATTGAASSAQLASMQQKVRRRCMSASAGLYPPGHTCVMAPTQLAALAPAPLASQAPEWSLIGPLVGSASQRQRQQQQQQSAQLVLHRQQSRAGERDASAGGGADHHKHSKQQQHDQHLINHSHHHHHHHLFLQQHQQQQPQSPQSKFRFDFERHLALGGPVHSKVPRPDEIDESISHQPPQPSELPPNYAFGDVGRLLRRYSQQGAGLGFDLSHGLAGPAQIPALAQALGVMPELKALSLRNDGLDDWALQVGFPGEGWGGLSLIHRQSNSQHPSDLAVVNWSALPHFSCPPPSTHRSC